jgi:Virulence-associated protein E-like domain
MSDFPDFKAFCEAACIKLWGEPDRKTKKELRWNGADNYGYRTFNLREKVWYDADQQCGGSTLELVAYAKGKPAEKLRGAAFFEAWQYAYEQEWLPDPPPAPKANGGGNAIIATYPYNDEQGALLFEVVRFDTSDVKERFRQRRPDGRSGWIWSIKGIRRVLYRLPELVAAVKASQRVLVCEGEKDANTAVRLGYAATTNPGGVGKWRPAYDKLFRGAEVVVVSDNDGNGKGQGHAAEVAMSLSAVAAQVRKIIFDVKDLTAWVEAGGTREKLDEIIAKAPPFVGKTPSTKEDYMKGKTALASNVGNVLLALKQEPEIMNAFGYDEMLRTEVLLRPLFGTDQNFSPRPVTDADVTAVQSFLQWFGFRRLGKGTTHEAVDKHAREHSFHPVRDYLNALKWDGKERLGTWLTDYLGAKRIETDKQNGAVPEYLRGIGTMFLIGLVARIFKPGCKLDYMIVLEGDQGTLKSTACAILAGQYFSDQLPDITSKEAFQHLRGKWLIEVAELRAYSRAAIDPFKEFLVRDTERYRPPWGRKEVLEPRQCCFIGTTNKALYLKDETGNRRFWPVKTGEINLDALRRDRDQLFAEAVHRFRSGEDWWPDAEFEKRCIVAEQEARFESDAWEKPIAEFLNRLPDRLDERKRTTILEIAIHALDYEEERPTSKDEVRGTPINRLTPNDQRRIVAILTHLEWRPKRNNHERWWEPKTS